MPGSSEIRAGAAFVEILAKDAEFVKKLAEDKKLTKEWQKDLIETGAKFAATGAMLTAPLLAQAGAFAEVGAEIEKASVKTGINTEALSKLKYAADQTGVGFDGL